MTDAKKEQEEHLRRLGLRPGPDARPRCVHCGLHFNIASSSAGEFGLCDDCLHKD